MSVSYKKQTQAPNLKEYLCVQFKNCIKMVEKEEPQILKSNKSIKTNLSVDIYGTQTSISKRKGALDDPNKAKSHALQRAREIQSSLDPDTPSFVKYMLRSHVASCFWLGLPLQFCKAHLPEQDTTMTLVNEDGQEYQTKFLADKTGLSAGWRGFSILHKLVEGDVLVFQLISPIKLKVYIIRADDFREVNVTVDKLDFNGHAKETDPVKGNMTFEITAHKRQKFPSLSTLQGENLSDSYLGVTEQPSGDAIKEEDIEALLCMMGSPGSTIKFKDVKNFESFTIMVDGFSIDFEISEYIRTKYYELCCSQKAFLHEHLLAGINFKLVAGIISDTVNIADAIKASKLSTFYVNFAIWDKKLMAFEDMGMNVDFLRARLQCLMSLGFESEQANDSQRLREARIEQACVEEEIRSIEVKLVELKEALKWIDAKTEVPKVKEETNWP